MKLKTKNGNQYTGFFAGLILLVLTLCISGHALAGEIFAARPQTTQVTNKAALYFAVFTKSGSYQRAQQADSVNHPQYAYYRDIIANQNTNAWDLSDGGASTGNTVSAGPTDKSGAPLTTDPRTNYQDIWYQGTSSVTTISSNDFDTRRKNFVQQDNTLINPYPSARVQAAKQSDDDPVQPSGAIMIVVTITFNDGTISTVKYHGAEQVDFKLNIVTPTGSIIRDASLTSDPLYDLKVTSS